MDAFTNTDDTTSAKATDDASMLDDAEGTPTPEEILTDTLLSIAPAVASIVSRWVENRAVRAAWAKRPRAPLALRIALGASARLTRAGRAARAFLVTYDRRLLAEECPLCVAGDAPEHERGGTTPVRAYAS